MNARQKGFAVAALRRASYKWPARSEALKRARIERGLYKCALCEGEFKKKETQLDHIQPVISATEGFINLDIYVARLLVEVDGWQVLCKECHNIKSSLENTIRKKRIKKKK